MTEQADGRRARGERTRRALMEATLRVVAEDGVGAVSHRRVCQEAGLPASSAAYHFPSITDLLEAALLAADERNSTELARIGAAADPVAELARWLADDFGPDQAACLAEYELYLLAARNPALRPAATQWLTDLSALVAGWGVPPRTVAVVCAYVDGMLIRGHVTGEPATAAEVEAVIRGLIEPSRPA